MAEATDKHDPAAATWARKPGQSFEDYMKSRVARYAERTYDFNALKFQADLDPRYKRAQMRYIGTGGTGVASDANTVPSAHFTFSTMVIPAGGIGPMHIHVDVEEVFFVMRGKMKIFCEKRNDDGTVERWESTLNERDAISVPPGVYREEHNIGQAERTADGVCQRERHVHGSQRRRLLR